MKMMWLLAALIGTRLGMFPDTQRDQPVGVRSVFAETLNKALVDGRHRQYGLKPTPGLTSKFVIVCRPPYTAMHPAPAGVFFQEFLVYLESVVLGP